MAGVTFEETLQMASVSDDDLTRWSTETGIAIDKLRELRDEAASRAQGLIIEDEAWHWYGDAQRKQYKALREALDAR